MTQTPRFRLQAKRVFLTYPQCPLMKERLYTFINEKYPIKYALISTELHEDGNTHLHAAIEFKKKIYTRSQATFDLEGYHPNIQAVKNWPATKNYVKKHGDFEEFNTDEDEDEDNIYELAKTMSEADFFEYCRKKGVQYAYASNAWRSSGSLFTIAEDYQEDELANVTSGLNSLDVSEHIENLKSIQIIGPSGCGKTTIAKRLATKPALFVTHPDGIRYLDGHHRSIIFDDMCFTHIPRESQIHLVDRFEPREIHVRYGTAKIPAKMEKWFTSNREIFLDDEAINRRVKKIYSSSINI